MKQLEKNACTKDSHYFLEFLQLPKAAASSWMRYRNAVDHARDSQKEEAVRI